jgi:microcystin-dependent protein
LPDLRGRAPVHPGTGPGLAQVSLGEVGGVEQTTVTLANLPTHGHDVRASADVVSTTTPGGNLMGAKNRLGANLYGPATGLTPLVAGTGGNSAGQSQAHDNMQPSLVVNFIIALVGIYPSRS